MYLSRFGVKNYKCLGDIDVPLTPIHVLIGENDAGKTSLLEAMEAFYASSAAKLRHVFRGPWEGRELVRHGANLSSLELHGEWVPHEGEEPRRGYESLGYGFAADFPPADSDCKCRGERIEVGGRTRHLGSDGSIETVVRHFRRHAQAPDNEAADIEAIRAVLRPAHLYSLNATAMAAPSASQPDQRKFRLDWDGFGLATLLDDILGYEPEVFISLREEFCKYFPQFKNVRLEPTKGLQRTYAPMGMGEMGMGTSGEGAGKGIVFETVDGRPVRAHHASHGAVLFLGFLALAHLPQPPALLLLEEPENGIYPKRLEQVIRLLQSLVNGEDGVRFPQIITATHSPYVLSSFKPEEVTFLSRPPDDPDGPVRARPLRGAPNIKERLADGFYLGELWYNLSEEDLFGEP